MKKIVTAACLISLPLFLFSQQPGSGNYSRREDYLMKSQRKERAGIILLSAGALVTAGSTILVIDGVHKNKTTMYGSSELNTGNAEIVVGVLGALVGIGAMSGSIPFFVSAHRSRVKAINLSFKTEATPFLYHTALQAQAYPALAFHIPLGNLH